MLLFKHNNYIHLYYLENEALTIGGFLCFKAPDLSVGRGKLSGLVDLIFFFFCIQVSILLQAFPDSLLMHYTRPPVDLTSITPLLCREISQFTPNIYLVPSPTPIS